MNIALLTLFHVAASVLALLAGALVLGGVTAGRPPRAAGRVFLAATGAMLGSGFLFPFSGVTPAVAVGALCVPILALAAFAAEGRGLIGRWGRAYAAAATALVYFNTLVLAAQLFLKTPALRELAPTQTSPAFIGAQAAILAGAVVVGVAAIRGAIGGGAGRPGGGVR